MFSSNSTVSSVEILQMLTSIEFPLRLRSAQQMAVNNLLALSAYTHKYRPSEIKMIISPREHEGTERDTEGVGCDMS